MIQKTSVRYVKNGKGGRWWLTAKKRSQVHLGWKSTPHALLLNPDYDKIKMVLTRHFKDSGAVTRDLNQLRMVLDAPDRHIWVTFEDGFLWWCTVKPNPVPNPNGETFEQGHFWLECDQPWRNESLGGKLLAMADLPGRVTTTAGFRGTCCIPKAETEILRILRDEYDPETVKAAKSRQDYEKAVLRIIQKLTPKDFEQLTDLILLRTGWARISTLGKTQEGIDIEAENLAAGEIAFVQVKSRASQSVLDDYVGRFKARQDYYSRMIFVVHSHHGALTVPTDLPVQLWSGEKLASLVVRLGLGEWVESRLA